MPGHYGGGMKKKPMKKKKKILLVDDSNFSLEIEKDFFDRTDCEVLTANAGPDQTVDEGVTVTLDASNSSDPDDGIASYLWEQTAGNPVTLSDPTEVDPTFVAPSGDASEMLLSFRVTVTDNGGLRASDEVSVTEMERRD